MIGRVVIQFVSAGHFPVHSNGNGTRIFRLSRHRIGIAIPAGVLQPPAAHVVTIVARRGVAILAEQPLRRRLDEKHSLRHIAKRQAARPFDPVLEES